MFILIVVLLVCNLGVSFYILTVHLKLYEVLKAMAVILKDMYEPPRT